MSLAEGREPSLNSRWCRQSRRLRKCRSEQTQAVSMSPAEQRVARGKQKGNTNSLRAGGGRWRWSTLAAAAGRPSAVRASRERRLLLLPRGAITRASNESPALILRVQKKRVWVKRVERDAGCWAERNSSRSGRSCGQHMRTRHITLSPDAARKSVLVLRADIWFLQSPLAICRVRGEGDLAPLSAVGRARATTSATTARPTDGPSSFPSELPEQMTWTVVRERSRDYVSEVQSSGRGVLC